MLVYCRDRSMKLPRKKGRYIKRKAPQTQRFAEPLEVPRGAYRAEDYRSLPSVLERRCNKGRWHNRDDDHANAILDSLIGQ